MTLLPNLTRILMLTTSLFLAGCRGKELVSSTNVRARVINVDTNSRRFWVSLIDENDVQYTEVRLGGKRCRYGPTNLPLGRELLVKVDTYRYPNDETLFQQIDSVDLRDRFCYQ